MAFATLAQEKIDGWLVFNTSNSSLPNNHVRDIAFDKRGYLWVGTWGGGLSRFNQDDGSWKLYNQTNSGIPGSRINQIYIAKDGKIWMAATDGGFGFFNPRDETWEAVKMPDGVKPLSIVVNSSGIALIGTQKNGLYVYSKDKILSKVWGEANNLDYIITDMTLDDKGNALVCTKFGLLRFTKVAGGMYTSVHKEISNFHVYKVIYNKKNDVIWAIEGKDSKVVKYTGKRWKVYKQGAPSIQMSINDGADTYHASEICLVNSRKYTMAMGTSYFGGIAVYGGKFWGAIYTPYSDVRMTGGIEALAQDKRDALWVGTWHRGLMVRVGEDLDDVSEDEETLEEIPEGEAGDEIRKKRKQKHMVRTRKVSVVDTLYSGTREVEILIWDTQKIDGDTVSLMLNDKFILENHALTKRPFRVRATLSNGKNNKLILYAHNLGEIPPNTATISILDLGGQKEVTLMSDKKNASAVVVIHDIPKSNQAKEEK
jgi:ligand-binding sensor domain-containing protein